MPYRDAKTKKWRGCVVKNGIRHTALMPTKHAAREWERAKKQEFQMSENKPSKIDCLTLCTKYLDFASRYSHDTQQEKEALCKRILQLWGTDCLAEDVTPNMVLEYLGDQARKRSANASNRDRKNLMAMFSFAIKFHGVPSNPVVVTDKLAHDRKTQYTPPEKDVLKVLMAATPEEKVFLTSYLQTGARRSEIFRWTWSDDINFAKKEVRLGTRKTKDGSMEYAWLPMSDDLYGQLLWWRDNHPIQGNPYVFYVTERGCPFYGQPYKERRKFLKGLCKKVGVKPFGFHAMRRYVASMLAETHNVSAKTIQRILRHKAVTTTERYIQNINHDLRDTLNLL